MWFMEHSIPVKHDPLGHGDNAVLRLIEGSQFGLYRVVGVRHGALRILLQAIHFERSIVTQWLV